MPSGASASTREADALSLSTVDISADGWPQAAGRSLCERGLCVLKGSPVPSTVCMECAASAHMRLHSLLDVAAGLELEPLRRKLKFHELCSRGKTGLRFDIRIPVLGAADSGELANQDSIDRAGSWAALQAHVDALVRSVLEVAPQTSCSGVQDALGSELAPAAESTACVYIDSAGCHVTLPGALDQPWHQDGSAPGLFNAFVPLVPMSIENGPTEFAPSCFVGSTNHDDSGLRPTPVLPILEQGEILLFDYRVWHRGRGNRSLRDRPVSYIVYARAGARDSHNFPAHASLFELARRRHDRGPVWLGTVKVIFPQDGNGFISCPDIFERLGQDVFVGRKLINEARAEVGCRVRFRVEVGRERPKASSLELDGPLE